MRGRRLSPVRSMRLLGLNGSERNEMFSPRTELEITNNMQPAMYGGLITLTAYAYNELLEAARNWDAYRSCGGSSRGDITDMGNGAVVRWEPQSDGSLKPVAP